MEVTIEPPRRGLGSTARSVLDSLPQWFGIPQANDQYVAFVDEHPTWSALDPDGNVVGILAGHRHTSVATEIHLLAVVPQLHRHGVGRALVEAFERDARADGVRIAQVKTLGPSHPDPGYALTRRFYEALGYLPLEELHDLWPGTPALIMVKHLL